MHRQDRHADRGADQLARSCRCAGKQSDGAAAWPPEQHFESGIKSPLDDAILAHGRSPWRPGTSWTRCPSTSSGGGLGAARRRTARLLVVRARRRTCCASLPIVGADGSAGRWMTRRAPSTAGALRGAGEEGFARAGVASRDGRRRRRVSRQRRSRADLRRLRRLPGPAQARRRRGRCAHWRATASR